MSAFSFLSTSLLSPNYNDSLSKCYIETKTDDEQITKIAKEIPDLSMCLIDMILRKTENIWREEHEKRFFFVMTQLTYARVKTLFEVTNDNPCECSEWNCVCDDKTDVDSACYFPHVFTKWDRIKQMDGVVTYIQRRQRLTSDGYSLFTFDPLTPFDFSHNKDPGTRMYWNMIGANCGLNEKFVFPYNADMETDLEPHNDIWFYTYQGVRCIEQPLHRGRRCMCGRGCIKGCS